MKQDKENKNHFTAEDGYLFKRRSDGFIAGKDLFLGYTHYLDGKPLPTPQLESIEDYDEILDPDSGNRSPIEEAEYELIE